MITLQAYITTIGFFHDIANKHVRIIANLCSKNYVSKLHIFILFLLVIGCPVSSSYDGVCKKGRNKIMHTLNSNVSKNGLYFLLTWNKGNSLYSNKRDDIAITLDRYNPDFFAVHEANFNILKDRGFDGYNLEYNTLHINNVILKGGMILRTH